MDEQHEEPQTRGRIQYGLKFLSLFSVYLIERLVDHVEEYAQLMLREKELFLGNLLILLGALNFNSDKFCDGNTADYLSCTRPSTYYYFDALDIALIVIGVFFVLLWFVRERR